MRIRLPGGEFEESPSSVPRLTWPQWFRGDDPFAGREQDVFDINWQRAQSESGVTWLHVFGNLESLTLGGDGISDSSLHSIGYLRHLKRLEIELPGAVTASGLAELKDLDELRVLLLNQSKIEQREFAGFPALRRLEDVCFESTSAGDEAACRLRNSPMVQAVNFSNTRIGSRGIECLSQIEAIHGLILDGTRVTDADMLTLGRLRKLTTLSVAHTSVTIDGARRLVMTTPECRVIPFDYLLTLGMDPNSNDKLPVLETTGDR